MHTVEAPIARNFRPRLDRFQTLSMIDMRPDSPPSSYRVRVDKINHSRASFSIAESYPIEEGGGLRTTLIMIAALDPEGNLTGLADKSIKVFFYVDNQE